MSDHDGALMLVKRKPQGGRGGGAPGAAHHRPVPDLGAAAHRGVGRHTPSGGGSSPGELGAACPPGGGTGQRCDLQDIVLSFPTASNDASGLYSCIVSAEPIPSESTAKRLEMTNKRVFSKNFGRWRGAKESKGI